MDSLNLYGPGLTNDALADRLLHQASDRLCAAINSIGEYLADQGIDYDDVRHTLLRAIAVTLPATILPMTRELPVEHRAGFADLMFDIVLGEALARLVDGFETLDGIASGELRARSAAVTERLNERTRALDVARSLADG